MELTDEQWEVLGPLIPEPARRKDGKGRPRREPRAILKGICWILRTGAQWADLPERYPPYQTCHRRFQEWERNGVLRQILETLAHDPLQRGKLDLSECFIDGTFVAAKKGGQQLVRLNGVRVAKSWRYRTLVVLASPCTLRLLAHMRSGWYTRLSHLDTSAANPTS